MTMTTTMTAAHEFKAVTQRVQLHNQKCITCGEKRSHANHQQQTATTTAKPFALFNEYRAACKEYDDFKAQHEQSAARLRELNDKQNAARRAYEDAKNATTTIAKKSDTMFVTTSKKTGSEVSDLSEAVTVCANIRDTADYGFGIGANEYYSKGIGRVYSGSTVIAQIHYNGRIEMKTK